MTTIPFDQFSKQMMEELLSPFGQVQLNREVLGASRYIDLWFSPQLEPRPDPSPLGLLGRLTTRPCLIETFRNAPSKDERESGYLKLQSIRSDFRREAKREKRTLTEEQLPLLWILTPTASARLLRCLGAQQMEGWPQGVYEAVEDLSTQVIVIHQLLETDETLWLRLLGKEETLQRAIEEVIALSPLDPRREQALKLLSNWKVTIEASGELDKEGGELAMALSQAYLEWEKQTEQRGRQQGVVQANLDNLLDVLEIRFGPIPDNLREELGQIQDADRLRALHREALGCPDLETFHRLISRGE